MILSMAQTNPVMFDMVAEKPEVAEQLEKLGRLRELLSTNQEELRVKQRDDWMRWIRQYRSENRLCLNSKISATSVCFFLPVLYCQSSLHTQELLMVSLLLTWCKVTIVKRTFI